MLKIIPQILNRKTINDFAESWNCVVNAPEGISRVSSRGGRTRQHVGDLEVVAIPENKMKGRILGLKVAMETPYPVPVMAAAPPAMVIPVQIAPIALF